jgi:HSP20 family protein
MDRLFDEAFRNFGFGSSLLEGGEIWSPAIDMRETDKGLELSAELPGVDEKDVEVTFADGALTIRGEKKADRDERGDG